ncbi:hypothetical protein [Nocardia thailandica]
MFGSVRWFAVIGAACAVLLAGCSEAASPPTAPGTTTAPGAANPSATAGPEPTATTAPPGSPTAATTPAPAPVTAPPGTATPAPQAQPTAVVTLVAVDAAGRPADGFTLPDPTPVSTLNCADPTPSRSATTAGVYRCGPSAAAADVCWPTPDRQGLLCAGDPWQRTLRAYSVDPALTAVGRTASPEPWALELADGRQCRIRVGGAWGGRADGLVGAYSCSGGHDVVLQQVDARTAIDTSSSTWTVAVGPLGSGSPEFPPPATVAVRTAYFAAAS